MSVKTILVSLPEPEEKSPYAELASNHGLTVDFRSFTHIEAIDAMEFREQKVNLSEHSAVILTSKIAVDHFFRISQEMRFSIPESMKYFCISETVAFYLQKYIAYRKRKIFVGQKTITDLAGVLKKHKDEKFLLPCADILRDKIPDTLTEHKINFSKAVLYRTVASDLSDLENVFYDMLVFFTPMAVDSLYKNFPDFKQNSTLIAVFGQTTANALTSHNLRLDIQAPTPENPSMTGAIQSFLKK